MNKLGEFLKKARYEKNLSLREFAKILDLSHGYLDKLEKGVDARSNAPVVPTIETLGKIAIGLNMSLNELLISVGYLEKSTSSVLNNGFKSKEDIYEEDLKNKIRELAKLLDVTEIVALTSIKTEGYDLEDLYEALKLIKSVRDKKVL